MEVVFAISASALRVRQALVDDPTVLQARRAGDAHEAVSGAKRRACRLAARDGVVDTPRAPVVERFVRPHVTRLATRGAGHDRGVRNVAHESYSTWRTHKKTSLIKGSEACEFGDGDIKRDVNSLMCCLRSPSKQK